MATTLVKNEVFELIHHRGKTPPHKYRLKFKGKLQPPKYACIPGELTIDGTPEIHLDFDARYFPEGYCYYVEIRQPQFEGTHHNVFIARREKEVIEMEFYFSVKQDLRFTMDINLIKVLSIFFSKTKKAGYRTDDRLRDDFEAISGDVIVSFPVAGNVHEHYKKHYQILEVLFNQAKAEVKANICSHQD